MSIMAAGCEESRSRYHEEWQPESSVEVGELMVKIRRGVQGSGVVGRDEREDIVQDIALEVIRKKRRVTWSWIKRRCIDAIRRKERRKKREREACATWRSNVPDDTFKVDGKHDLNYLIKVAEMSDFQREILYLRFYREMKLRDIASKLGSSLGGVTTNLNKAIGQLRKAAEGEV